MAIVIGSALGAACTPGADRGPSADVIESESIDLSCEIALRRLDDLIDQCPSRPNCPEARLFEAKELRRLGRQLYLEREYEFALELIGEGIELLQETSG